MQLLRLTLTDFRSYAALTWRPRGRIAVLFGPNGSGKTNLLEAVSLLVPGRGLRGARNADLKRHGAPNGWAVAARFATAQGETDIGTGTPPSGSSQVPSPVPSPGAGAGQQPTPDPGHRRVFRLDGTAPRSQAEIAARIAAVWLTPQMDRLFLEGLSGRRRFLDRLVWALEPGHAREIASHDAAMGSRNRLLQDGRPGGGWDPSWLAGLEDEMARHAVAATAARMALVGQLNAALARRRGRRVPRGTDRPGLPDRRTPRRPSQRWRWRTGCAPASPPTARAMPRPAPRRWARTAPTWRWRMPRPAPPPHSPARESRRRC